MAIIECKSVDDYIALQPDTAKSVLERVRSAIRKAIPDAEEVISYKIPGYKLNGRPILYFAGWKQHYSLYPATRLVLETFKAELENYEVDKSTIRFSFNMPVPAKLIEKIAKLRAKEAAENRK